uniref:DUF4347 domain-containing protein n=1 Tax=Anaerovorax odorimutans TaxID=109327 RepID=UPI00056C11E0
MKRRNKGFNTYQQSLFNKYEIDESYLETHKQRRACIDLLEKIDKNQQIDERRMIEKIADAFQGTEIYKKIASCVTIAALLVTLQTTPIMAQAVSDYQSSALITNTLKQDENDAILSGESSVVLDEDSFLSNKNTQSVQDIKTTSLHMITSKAPKNSYEPIEAQGVLIDGDSDITYFEKQERKILTVIDTSLEDWELLRDGVKEGEILLLDGKNDPLDAILSKLEAMKKVDCLNIISHGTSGELKFKNGAIDIEELEKDKDKWQKLSGYLSKDGDIQLFGCNVAKGEEGKNFITKLAQVTGADVAASINPTGAEDKGGDWTLEAVVGDVASKPPFTKEAMGKFIKILWPTSICSYNDLTDNGATLSNDYFLVSANVNGTSVDLDKYYGAYASSSSSGTVAIKVAANGSSLSTFRLDAISLLAFYATYADLNNVRIVGHYAGGTFTVTDSYVHSSGGAKQADFTGFDILSSKDLDYFTVYADTTNASTLQLDSFSVSNMTAPAPANNSPTISNSSKDGTEDTTMSFAIADFNGAEIYADEESDALSKVQIVTLPANGTLKVNDSNVTAGQDINAADLANITFVPTADFNGDTNFTWKASDGNSYSSAATMTLAIAAVNDAPTVSNHTFTTNEDTAINGDLTTYAADADTGDHLTYVKVKDPSHGSVTVNTDGTFTYTPDTNYVGTDSFTWKVNDGTVYSEEATATITVNEVNDAPTV